MINLGEVNVGNEITLNFFQSQIYNEVLKKFEQFGIAGYDIDHESYIIQKTLAKHIAETVSVEEENLREIPRMSQIVFQTLTNPDLYDSDIVDEGLIQWIEIGNPYSFFSKKNIITDLSGLANDVKFPFKRVRPKGFRKNGTVINNQIPSLEFRGRGSRLNASTVIDDLLEPTDGETNGLVEGSVEMWVNLNRKKPKGKERAHTLCHAHCTGTPFGVNIFVLPNGTIQVRKFTYDTDADGIGKKEKTISISPKGVIKFGEWLHIVVVFVKDGVICYVNTKPYKLMSGDDYSSQAGVEFPNLDGPVRGFLDGFGSVEDSESEEKISLAPDNLWIGARRLKQGKFDQFLNGSLSSLRIYEKALDTDEVETNFDESKGQYTGE